MKKDKMIFARIDARVFAQLKRYADRNDEGQISTSARKALCMFLEEEKLKNK